MHALSEPPEPRSDVEPEFLAAMRHVAAPVAVVTTLVGRRPLGTTVSAFDSLSMRPAMMTVALQASSSLLSALRRGAPVGVNVLADDQITLAQRFAARVEDRFRGVPWQVDCGAPRLGGTHAWFALSVRDHVPGGDHVVVVCDVEAAEVASGRPLVHHDRRFGTIASS
ncbi:NADH-FMN oxidoreductase RutF, flavin reductase (DIM6/NTAB) family [Pedococcus cremeus]|uniref:NADH-FMN oxidoreductase RutF, flavin reductase (DIM6/NTAB) family n=1 Tax=Pedococcus cremeus TaxID=587636 RepID=A0A1H9RS31_9MICO|nr:flavin reductase family protein [Pedococcus cremeus]SER75751.1 NADH-FMN oxidoreductase RutF, flavin reductase (DIM6/NTAB) family [Pedococcus cremeus]